MTRERLTVREKARRRDGDLVRLTPPDPRPFLAKVAALPEGWVKQQCREYLARRQERA